MMMSGSCRSKVFTPDAKSRPILCCTCIWLKLGSTSSIGSSTVQNINLWPSKLFETGIQRCRLTGTGRSGHQDDAKRSRNHTVPDVGLGFSRAPSAAKFLDQHFRIKNSQHKASHQKRWGILDRRNSISTPPGESVLMRPSCGLRFSATSSRPMILIRLTTAGVIVAGIS